MPLPNLLHPVKVVMELINRTDTVYDRYAREPVTQLQRSGESPRTGTRYTLRGQVSFYFASAKTERAAFTRDGVVYESTGYVTFRFVDLIRRGLLEKDENGAFANNRIQFGDRVVQLGNEPVDYYVVGFKHFAFYPGLNQTLLQVDFMDRAPVYREQT